ncbi:MAG: outer membrane beta-barrel protein, partial [Acidobacteriota bacterium]
DDEPWRLRGNATWVDPSVGISDDELQSDGELGASVSVERRLTPLVGLEIGALYGESFSSQRTAILDGVFFQQDYEVDFTALTAALNFHLTPGRKVDLYLGPMIALIDFSDTEITDFRRDSSGLFSFISGRFGSSEELALGAQIGADIGLGTGPWSLNLSAKYLETSYDVDFSEGSVEIDFDPLILGVGFSYRF